MAPVLCLAYAGGRLRNRRIGEGLAAILGVENRPTQISRQRRTKQWAGIVSRQTVETVRCGATGGGIELLVRLVGEVKLECVDACTADADADSRAQAYEPLAGESGNADRKSVV